MAKACDYALRIWQRLEVFLDNGAVEADTNLAENAMRPVALGRKNWLHIGDEKAGPKIAAILSVLATCERLGIDAREYLADVLPRLGQTSTGQVASLTPQAWQPPPDTPHRIAMGSPDGYVQSGRKRRLSLHLESAPSDF